MICDLTLIYLGNSERLDVADGVSGFLGKKFH